jgi:hypothetical protein
MWAWITDRLDLLHIPLFLGMLFGAPAYLLLKKAFKDDEDIGWLFRERWWLKPTYYALFAIVVFYPFVSSTYCQNVPCKSNNGRLEPRPPVLPK